MLFILPRQRPAERAPEPDVHCPDPAALRGLLVPGGVGADLVPPALEGGAGNKDDGAALRQEHAAGCSGLPHRAGAEEWVPPGNQLAQRQPPSRTCSGMPMTVLTRLRRSAFPRGVNTKPGECPLRRKRPSEEPRPHLSASASMIADAASRAWPQVLKWRRTVWRVGRSRSR